MTQNGVRETNNFNKDKSIGIFASFLTKKYMANFILLLVKHKRLGYILLPRIAEKQDAYYNLRNLATHTDKAEQNFTDVENQILRQISEYDEHVLNRVFDNRQLTVKEFWEKTDDEKIRNHIRPYIERHLIKIFRLLQQQPVEVFLLNSPHYDRVYFDYQIELSAAPAETVFNFEKLTEGTRYYLTLRSGKKEINLFEKKGFVVAFNPCLVLVGKELMMFEDIDGKKLLPFFKKQFIEVQPRAEETYFNTFIKKSIEKFRVNATGFEIIEEHPVRSALLHLENDFTGDYHLILTFRYGHKEILANKEKQVFVRFEKENGQFIFYRLRRDMIWEGKMAGLLRQMHLEEAPKGIFKLRSDLKGVLQKQFFVTEIGKISEQLKNEGFEFIQDVEHKEYYLGEIYLDIQKSKKEPKADFFGINAVVKFGEFQIPFIRFRKYILKGNHEYILPDGKIAVLPENWFTDYHDLLQFSEEKGDEIILKTMHLPLLGKMQGLLPEEIISKYRHLLEIKNKKDEPLPEKLKGTLRSYQLQGYSWMIHLQRLGFGACLADDMGLGKTLQTIALLMRNKALQNSRKTNENRVEEINSLSQLSLFSGAEDDAETVSKIPSLIVVPKSLLFNWLEEFEKFAPSYRVKVINTFSIQNMNNLSGLDAFLITYGMLRQHVEKFESMSFETMVLDESQNIKNPFSLTYQAVMRCSAKQKIVLTGTPVENSLVDLWAQMNFINPGMLGNLSFFKKEYISAVGKAGGEKKIKKLSTLIYPFLLRRTKLEVEKDLPSLTVQQVKIEMTEEQAAFYEDIRIKTRNALFELMETGRRDKISILILQGIMKLRLAANHPGLVDDHYPYSSGKLEVGLNLINTLLEEKHKVLVFSAFVKHLQLYADYFRREHIPFEMLTGKDSQNGRKQKVQRFQNDNLCSVFLISLKAGGTGLNLTAADYVVLLDPWWNPAVEKQAIDRTHRIGQDKKIIAYKLITKETIEEKIFKYQQRKSQMAQDILTTDDLTKSLSNEEIMALFD